MKSNFKRFDLDRLHCNIIGGGDVGHKYPSSSHYTRNWDKLEKEVKEEEKNEKLEGDAALNKLFQQIYSDGTDETKKAMMKSFVSFLLHLFL
jgi:hypothetical protein